VEGGEKLTDAQHVQAGPRPGALRALLLLAVLAFPPVPLAAEASAPHAAALPGVSHSSANWPPQAWRQGHADDLTLAEAAFIVAHVRPADPAAQDLARQLEGLTRLPAEYEATTRIVLQALAQAMWHEDQALAGLSPRERQMVLAADPNAPITPELQQALANVDDAQVAQAATVLLAASQQVQELLRDPLTYSPRADGGALALARKLGYTGPIRPVSSLGEVSADALAHRLAVATGAPAAALLRQAEAIPPAPRASLARLLVALEPFRAGAPLEPAPRLVALAATLDEEAPVLRGWAAANLAEALYGRTGVDLRPPRPDGPISLRWGLPDTGERLPLPARSMGDSAADLTGLLLPEAAATARQQAEEVASHLTQEQSEAIARAWDAAGAYIRAIQAADKVPLPDGVDLEGLVGWARTLAAGKMAAGDPGLTGLQQALPFLEAQWTQQAAQEDLLAAAEGILPPFQSAQASSDPNCQERTPLLFLLAIDECGRDSEWSRDVLLSIDAGGDDTYRQRAGAPFLYDPATDLPAVTLPIVGPAPKVSIPFNLLLDLGGSDSYVTKEDCAQAAACTGLHGGSADTTGVSNRAPLSVLVDWNGPEQPATNRFQAGNRSQAFAGPLGSIALTPSTSVPSHAPLAILVEAVANSTTLTSTYEAKDRSQGSATNDHKAATRYFGGHAVLERLSGNASRSQATFTAGDFSQGVADFGGTNTGRYSLGALLNLAGANATANDSYTAGTVAQGAIDDAIRLGGDETSVFIGFSDALFIDAVGPGAASDDTYAAQDKARGFLNNFGTSIPRPMRALFIDAALTVQGSNPAGSVHVGANSVEVVAALDDRQRSNDTYTGPIGPGQGYGWSMQGTPRLVVNGDVVLDKPSYVTSGFLDVSGADTYALPPSWEDVRAVDRPANDNVWPHLNLPNLNKTSVLHGGTDITLRDNDHDGWPAALESLWTAWGSDPDSNQSAVVADRVFLGTAAGDHIFDGAYALVLTVGGTDAYQPGFSAGIQLDLAGDDKYLGRPGVASGAFSEDGDPGVLGPPITQHPLSFSWDVGGNDTYASSLPRTQGFGQAGGVGLLVDQAGSDRYLSSGYGQGSARAGALDGVANLRTPASVGLLLDVGLSGDRNLFRADRATSQGWSDSPTALGVLLATGGHNTFADGTRQDACDTENGGVHADPKHPEDTTQDLCTGERSSGSANLGDNEPPGVAPDSIMALPGAAAGTPQSPLQAETSYTFTAQVEDPKGDDLTVCWTFEHGAKGAAGTDSTTACAPLLGDGSSGPRTAAIPFAWGEMFPVNSDGRIPERATVVPFKVTVAVQDPGGQKASAERTFWVRHAPLSLAGAVQGPGAVTQGQAAAYQLPVRDPVPAGVVTEADWGDGTPATSSPSVDWALAQWGSRAHAAERAPVPGKDGTWAAVSNRIAESPPSLLIDGDLLTAAEFTTSDSSPLVHVGIDLPGPRRVSQVRIDGTADVPFLVSVEGVLPDGSLRLLGEIELDGAFSKTVPVAGSPALASVVLRQVLPIASSASLLGNANLRLAEVAALGPGVSHQWRTSGTFHPSVAVLDPLGGRNGTRLDVQVDPLPAVVQQLTSTGPGALSGLPLALDNVDGHGPVRHATIAAGSEAFLLLRSIEEPDGPCGCLAVDWGDDGATVGRDLPAGNAKAEFRHTWATPGDYLVKASVNGRSADLFWAHVEEAFDLRSSPTLVDANDPQPPSDTGIFDHGEPLLYLALNRSDLRTSWRAAPVYRALVDAAGDDRYVGPWAAPPTVSSAPLPVLDFMPRAPGLVVDLAGNDDYLAWDQGAQGFGSLGAVGVLLDAAGDDLYVAPGRAQGAAVGHGAGLLADLGGDDVFDPVAPVVRDAMGARIAQPDLAAANATLWAPWLPSARPLSLTGPRTPLAPPSARLVQGASEEGLGLLLTRGGFDRLAAESQAQGHAAHAAGTSSLLDYTTAGGDECMQTLRNGNLASNTQVVVQNLVNCFLGFSEWSCANGPPCPGPIASFPDPSGGSLVCLPNTGPPVFPCVPKTDGLDAFTSSGPRYGSPLGLLVELDGATSHHARRAAQGHAEVGAHAVLADTDGAALFSAVQEGQAATEGGQALLLSAGPNGAWLADTGQEWSEESGRNPESVPQVNGGEVGVQQPLALFLAPGSDHLCAGPECGTPTLSLPDPAPRLVTLAWAPGSAVDASSLPLLHDGTLRVAFTASSDLSVDVDLVALAQPAAGSDGTHCTGAAIAPPTVLLRDAKAPLGTQTAEVDLGARLADGPVLPAGCHRVRVFARPAGVPGAAWSVLAGDVRVLPSPLPDTVGERIGPDGLASLVTAGGDVTLHVRIQEPLMATALPSFQVELRTAAGGQPPSGSATVGAWAPLPDGSWGADVAVHPPAANGAYRVDAVTYWPDAGVASAQRHPLATLEVSDQPPTVQASPLPSAWQKGGAAIPLTGTVEDHGRGLRHLALRLVDGRPECASAGSGCVLKLFTPRLLLPTGCVEAACAVEAVPAFPGRQGASIQCPVGQCSLQPGQLPPPTAAQAEALLRIDAVAAGVSQWSVLLQPDGSFLGGPMRLQAQVTDGHGATGAWTNLAVSVPAPGPLGLDAGAPRLLDLTTAGNATDTNQDFPIFFTARLRDCAAAATVACPAGSGIDPASLSLLVRGPGHVTVLKPTATVPQDGGLVATFAWTGDGRPAPGSYRVMVQATDRVGNLLSSNPGMEVRVDFQQPDVSGLTLTLPQGQAAVKPGDVVGVTLHAEDFPESASISPSGVVNVTVAVGSTLAALASGEPGQWDGQVTVPAGLLAPGGAQGLPVAFTVTVRDAAGNVAQVASTVPYYTPPPTAASLSRALRDTNVEYTWTADRPLEVVQAQAWPTAHPTQKVEGQLTVSGLDYRVAFTGLAPDTNHTAAIVLRDPAGNPLALPLTPFRTFVRVNSTLDKVQVLDGTLSRIVRLDVTLKEPVAGTLRLFTAPGNSTPVDTVPVDVQQQEASVVATLLLNTTAAYPLSTQHAIEVHPWIQYEAGATLLTQPLTLRVDNRAPTLAIHAVGAVQRNGWYNRSLEIDAGAIDDTGPLNLTASIDGALPKPMPVRLLDEGEFSVAVIALDGAVPPNRADGTATFRIDRTPPTLYANLTRQATNEPKVGLQVQAKDPGDLASGIEAFRVRIDDDPAGPWLPQAPQEVALPAEDGAHWVGVQAIDQAGNLRSVSSSVLLDTKPPEVLRLQWFGTARDGARMLQFVARDRIHDAPRPAGIDALRFITGDHVAAPWANTTGVGTAAVPTNTSLEGMTIQFRDAAGNLGDPVPLPPWSPPPADQDTQAESATAPGPWLAQSPAVSPAVGDSTTPFTFTVVARPWHGKAPDAVEVRIAGEAHAMEPKGTPAKDGSRLYAADIRLPPTDVANPHRFQVRLLYGEQEVVSQDATGPTVLSLSPTPPGTEAKKAPATPALWALAALVAAVALRRRRDAR
jgi:MYXO-CTERM domain-containing protein